MTRRTMTGTMLQSNRLQRRRSENNLMEYLTCMRDSFYMPPDTEYDFEICVERRALCTVRERMGSASNGYITNRYNINLFKIQFSLILL